MALITFMSDYGLEDHYVAATKGILLSLNRQLTIVDISHEIKLSDISHGGYVLRNAFKKFPIGTVHFITMNSSRSLKNRWIGLTLEGHHFIGTDSGIFSIISNENPSIVVEICPNNLGINYLKTVGQAVNDLATGSDLKEIGKVITDHLQLIDRTAKITKKGMIGHVIHIDHYGNLITNIQYRDYLEIQKINGQVSFQIQIGREIFDRLHEGYDAVEPGECFVFFNSEKVLQIGINMGRASELLGIRMDASVYINFNV
ncbi:MAG: S-adenosyl-l-methionine hydroxide adenosyltransferase [Flammeovirgaceae bacterium]|nr:S-adenosyl-l-methionine hydroxide adenosyltransferase [Flammeovirgaceae bacterium]|tara:strand:+ start:2019 stop:2792 length:774 start_codon:yes stop_codon:yes gene_type:complete